MNSKNSFAIKKSLLYMELKCFSVLNNMVYQHLFFQAEYVIWVQLLKLPDIPILNYHFIIREWVSMGGYISEGS